MNSRRACSSPARRRRMRSNARASWPSSSGLESSIGSSNFPPAIRSAARSRSRMRRAKKRAPPRPSSRAATSAISAGDQDPVLDEGHGLRTSPRASSRRGRRWSPAGWAASAYLRPPRVTTPRAGGPGLRGPVRDRIVRDPRAARRLRPQRSLSSSGDRLATSKIVTRVFVAAAEAQRDLASWTACSASSPSVLCDAARRPSPPGPAANRPAGLSSDGTTSR